MFKIKTATVAASLFFVSVAHTHAETTATLHPATGGLRIQIDSEGRRLQVPPEVSPNGSAVNPGTMPAAPQGLPRVARPHVIHENAASGKVVRLNGLFRAGSRATLGADGKLQGDCHVDTKASAEGNQ